MPGIGVIVNQNSNIYRKDPSKVEDLAFIVEGKGHFKATRNMAELETAVADFKAKDIKILAISGGDGTLQATLSTFAHLYKDAPLPKIALLRGGTMNTVATSLKIRGTPQSILAGIIRKIEKDEPFKRERRNLICVNGEFGFLFGNGLFYNFLKIYHEKAYPSVPKGFFLLSKTSISALFCTSFAKSIFEGIKTKLTIDGKELAVMDLSSVSCSTIPYIGFGFNPYFRALEKDGSFHIIGFPKNPRTLALNLPKFFLGRDPKDPNLFNDAGSTVIIETGKPVGYQLDGELKNPTSKVTVQIGPRLTFIM
jgi:diacylglycerol kinase (ATP)